MPADMIEVMRLTRSGRLAEATALLQGRPAAPPAPAPSPATARSPWPAGPAPRIIDVEPDTTPPSETFPLGTGQPFGASPGKMREWLARLAPQGAGMATAGAPLPPGASFAEAVFSSAAGSRAYKLYIPAARPGGPMPLLVMLHGCTQSPDDFAAGTRMNQLAEEFGCLVVYPAQPPSANAQKCWNWFSPGDQQRDRGEPALIAGIARDVLRQHNADPARVYVAGLSAGGAAAAIMGLAYPDLFAAVGVHSGLACGAARDMPSAFAAMRQGAAAPRGAGPAVPTIVFHADHDSTVHPSNGDHVIAQSAGPGGLRPSTRQGQVTGGRAYTQTLHRNSDGQTVLEQWLVHGGGHAWSGGDTAGSYTDPRGPDASREMLRFFLEHPRAGGR